MTNTNHKTDNTARSSIVGQPIWYCYGSINAGDHIRVECNSSRGQSSLTGKVKEVKIVEKIIRYPIIKLDSGWCINEADIVVEHTPAGEKA